MPLINGQEIEYTEKQIVDIQRKINVIDDLKADLKSEIKPQVVDETHPDYTSSGFSLFEEQSAETINRKSRYGFFREMDEMEFIHRALEVVSDDGSQENDEGNVMKFFSDDEDIKTRLETLFLEKLDMNNELWTIFYETCKMGDNFYEIIVDDYKKPKSVIFLRYLDSLKMDRKEENGRLSHFIYRTKKEEDKSKTSVQAEEVEYRLQPWQIIHFKIENKQFLPYGGSLLNAGIKTYRRLSLLEDVMLVYRISRAPEKRVFYIDVGNLNKVDSRRFLEKIKNTFKTQSFLDESGKINKKAHILSITSDIYVPVREGSQGTKIEVLAAGEALHNIDDMKYFRDKILRTMNIPPAYLGEQTDRSRGSLAQLDIKFSRFIERIQSQVLKGINKIAALELFFNGLKKDDLNNFKIELTPPSNIKEITEIDVATQKMNLVATIQQLNLFSSDWILREILKMSEKEIVDIQLHKQIETKQQPPESEAGAPMPGGMEAPPEEEMPPEEAPPEAGAEAPPEEMAASTIIKKLGKEFIVENSKDFFKLIKYIKEKNNSKKTKIPLLEKVSEIVLRDSKTQSPRIKKTKDVSRQVIINEFGGLDFKERKIKLFESYNDKQGNKKYRVKSHKCAIQLKG